MLINTVLEKPIEITTGWNKTEKYDSIFDMVETKLTALYEKKIGSVQSCEKDPLLARVENHIDQKVKTLLTDVDKIITKHAEKHATKAVKENQIIQALSDIVVINEKKR